MANAFNPRNPEMDPAAGNTADSVPGVTPELANRARFDSVVDSAFRTFYGVGTRPGALEPRDLLAYAAGTLGGEALERFESRLETRPMFGRQVVRLVKTARPCSPDAALDQRLASSTLRGLMRRFESDGEIGPDELLGIVSRACHQAVLRGRVDEATRQRLDDDPDSLPDPGDDDPTLRALTLGAAGKLAEAEQAWKSAPETDAPRGDLIASLALAADAPLPELSDSPLASLLQRLSEAPRERDALLRHLVDETCPLSP